MFVPHRKHLWPSTVCYGDFFILYVDDVRSSQETHLWASTASYGDNYTCLYVDDVLSSQETHVWASTACYGDSFTCLYVGDVRSSQETNLWASTACTGSEEGWRVQFMIFRQGEVVRGGSGGQRFFLDFARCKSQVSASTSPVLRFIVVSRSRSGQMSGNTPTEPWLLPSKSSPIGCSPAILIFDARVWLPDRDRGVK
jgi:hypothetical protein